MHEEKSGNLPTKPSWRLACSCAMSDGVPTRSLGVALVVGTVLNLINQGDAILAMERVSWLKIVLTYCVPYAVCTYGAVSSRLASPTRRSHAGSLPTTRA